MAAVSSQTEEREGKGMITGTLNRMEVDRIFQKEAVLIGKTDVIPYEVAVEYLGKSAVEFASICGVDYNEYWLGDKKHSLRYLYKKGFEKAATHYNIMVIIGE